LPERIIAMLLSTERIGAGGGAIYTLAPRFEITRAGNTVTVTVAASANGYYEPSLGYYVWDGEISASFGAGSDYFYSDFDRPLDAQASDTVVAGVETAGSYDINYGSFSHNFTVIVFDTGSAYTGGAGSQYMFGSDAVDNLFGGEGNDGFEGGGGNDRLNGGKGADFLDGGAGRDYASYIGADAGVVVRLHQPLLNTGDAAGDRFISIENLAGSDHNDSLYGDEQANVLLGGLGNDKLYGFTGNDLLIGGGGPDAMYGGSGSDTASYAGAAGSVSVSLRTGDGTQGEAAGDTLFQIENLIGSDHDDTLEGSFLANEIRGGAGGDDIRGGGADDELYGQGGTDTIRGGAGGDVLNGGLGNDLLLGGSGPDSFVFDSAIEPVANVDTLGGYNMAEDRILLDDAIFTTLAAGPLNPLAFALAAVATTGDHRILYDPVSGFIRYDFDGDGTGAAITFARISAGLVFSAGEFEVI
jgi:Ca2+-binding RTX toxin-like protein